MLICLSFILVFYQMTVVNNWEQEKYPALEIGNSNWFEALSDYEDERPNFAEVLEAEKFTDAVIEAIDLIIEFKE